MVRCRSFLAGVGVATLLAGCAGIERLLPVRQVTVTAPAPTPSATSDAPSPTPSLSAPSTPQETSTGQLSWQEVLERSRASVVQIRTTYCDESYGAGTGFVVGDDLVMTAAHVVMGGRLATVQLDDGSVATTQLLDLDEATDSALLRVKDPIKASELTLSPDGPDVTDEVAAVGYPLSYNTLMITTGTVSALHIRVDYADQTVDDAFISSTPTNPGNSGGPLLDRGGQVVGLVSGGRDWDQMGEDRRPVEGIHYGIPSPQLAANLERWRDADARGFEACDSDLDEGPGEGEPTLRLSIGSTHPDARDIGGTLFTHGESINGGSYASAWRMFTPAIQRRMGGLEKWSKGVSTSYWRSLELTSVSRSGSVATAAATLTTEQDPSAGFRGQTCSVHRMQYRLVLTDGVWLIDRARRPQDPTAC